MSATEADETAGKSLDPGKDARYGASIRLSVAPMMDWTASSFKGNYFK